jgi:4-amino-4-deoxy-L-arabinose transferase-like glycosyltransferase
MTDLAPPSSPGKAHRIALAAVLLLAAGLRFAELNRQSIWFDEAASIHIATRPTLDEMMTRIRADERIPPLHYIVLRYWIKVFGDSEISVRLPSALASIAAVWAMYSLVRRLFGPGEGLIAPLLLAVSRFQVIYAAEARSYSLMLALGLFSCNLFVQMTQRRCRKRKLSYVLITTALLYAHLYGLFVIGAQWIAYLLSDKSKLPWRGWLALNAAVLALFAPWIPTAIEWTRSVAGGLWAQPATPYDIVAAYCHYTGSAAMAIVLAVFAVFAIVRTRDRRRLALLIALATLPVIVPIVISILTKPNFAPRYAILAPAGLYALAAVGVWSLPRVPSRYLVTALLVVLSLFGRESEFIKPDWRGAAGFINRAIRPGDVVVINRKLATYLYDYYVRRPDVRRIGFDSVTIPLSDDMVYERVWLVVHSDRVKPQEIIRSGRWQVISKYTFDRVMIFELRMLPPQPSSNPAPA